MLLLEFDNNCEHDKSSKLGVYIKVSEPYNTVITFTKLKGQTKVIYVMYIIFILLSKIV